MNDTEEKQPKNLVFTTDCLEAISVFKAWKNFLFVIILLCMLLLQGSFWIANAHLLKAEKEEIKLSEKTIPVVPLSAGQTKIDQAAKQVVTGPNQPALTPPKEKQKLSIPLKLSADKLALLIRILNFILIPAAAMYCLILVFSLKVSLVGRLGGINHIARAFFLSLLFLVLILPWQVAFEGYFAGVIFAPKVMLEACKNADSLNTACKVLFYLRYTAYWLAALVLLVLAQIRSYRWAKNILRRLELA